MSGVTQEYLELMQQKTAILERVLELTRGEVFTGEVEVAEKEAEAFANLYERRDNILKRMVKIIARLEEIDLPKDAPKCFTERVDGILDEQRAMASELLAMDKANIALYEKLKAHLQGNMKNVRQTIELNERYMDESESPESVLFDRTN